MTIGCGLWRVDGPLPLKPGKGLLQVADALSQAVRVVPDLDGTGVERWPSGVEMYPGPRGVGETWDPWAFHTTGTKGFGSTYGDHPQFAPFLVVFAETCTAYSVPTIDELRARAIAGLEAVESGQVEHEILTGSLVPLSPHFTDGNTHLAQAGATSPVNALAILENFLARQQRKGLIHMSPGMATALASHLAVTDRDGVVVTVNGNVVVPGVGYALDNAAAGQAATGTPAIAGGAVPTGNNQEYLFATGPIEIRRSAPVVVPDTVNEALDRGIGNRPNSITYRAERAYLVTWDPTIQAAVLADRCREGC